MALSFDEFLANIGGAAGQSQAAPWQEHVRNQAGGSLELPNRRRQTRPAAEAASGQGLRGMSSGLPRLPGLGGSGMSAAELERAMDPRLTEGLQMAGNQFLSAQQHAQAAGLEDLSGEPPQGFLNKLFRTIDLPRAMVFNAIRSGLDPNMNFEDFLQAIEAREGFGDLGFIEFSEDDNNVVRAMKALGAFAGDVATDPLMLVSFGSTAVGKKLGAEAVKNVVSRRAVDHLGQDSVRSLSRFSLSAQARAGARKQVKSPEGRATLKRLADQSVEIDDPVRLGSEALGDIMADTFQLGGSTGLRKGLIDGELPQQVLQRFNLPGDFRLTEVLGGKGKKLWESLPTDMKGGLRLRVPFSRQEQVRRAVAIAGGGGQFAEALGLGRTIQSAHKWRNVVRASKAGQAVSKAIGGADGDLYGKMLADLVHTGPASTVQGSAHATYMAARQGRRVAERAKREIGNLGDETLGRIRLRLGKAGSDADVAEAKAAYHRWANDPEEMMSIRRSANALEDDEMANYFLNMGDQGSRQLTKNEVLGLESAAELHDTLRHMFQRAVEAGVPIERLNDHYVPHQLTRAKREEIAAKRVTGTRVGRVRGDDPTKRRRQMAELVWEPDADGVLQPQVRFKTVPEANEAAKRRAREVRGEVDPIDFYEADPDVILARYTNALAHIVHEAEFARGIKRAGQIIPGDLDNVPVLVSRELAEGQKRIEEVVRTLDELPVEQQTEAIRGVLSDVDQLRAVFNRLLSDETLPNHVQAEEVGKIVRAMDALIDGVRTPAREAQVRGQRKLFTVDDAEKTLASARREFEKAKAQIKKSIEPTAQPGEVAEAFLDLGLSPVGVQPGDAVQRVRALPPEIDKAYAPEMMRLAINNFYEMADPKKGKNIIDRWYRPYHTFFKTTATIGRGPGFHIRNIVGGEWNLDIIGATGADRRVMARYVKELVQTGRQARKLETDEIVQKLGVSRREAARMPGFEEGVARRAEDLLEGRLSKVNVYDDVSLYDVHRMIDDYQVGWRQGQHHALADAIGAGRLPTGVGQDLPATGPVSRALRALGKDPQAARMRGQFSANVAQHHPGRPRSKKEALALGLPEEEALSIAQRGAENISNLWWVRFNAGAAEMVETYLRGTAFVTGLRKYKDPESARLMTLASQFDYQDLSHIERQWLRGGLLPFYTWTRYNIPLQMRALFQQPGKMNRINLLLDNAEEAFGDDDIDILPEWMRTRFMFASRFKFDGNPIAFGVETPAQDLNEFFKVPTRLGVGPSLDAIQAAGKALMSATNPAFQVPFQYATGTEFFTGARLDEDAGRHAPWWYQRLPQSVAPTWVNSDGDVMGDARLIVSGPGAVPWLGQSEKILAILAQSPELSARGAEMVGADDLAEGLRDLEQFVPEAIQPPQGRNRVVSDLVRQAFPVATAGTLTPQSEAGELFQRARRLRTQAERYSDPEDMEIIRQLRDLGMSTEDISRVMEHVRAQRAAGRG